MSKIESIRPGGTLESSFEDYPLADLLLGVLRGNLTGRLDLGLGPVPQNRIFFKDGVPVVVDVPDLGISLSRILVERGVLPRERALEIARKAEELGSSESRLILEENILPIGTLDDARRRRAREQLVRLFDVGPARFCFTEGSAVPEDAPLTILQPLPIVYEGLLKSKDRRVVARFLQECGSASFRLGVTYPRRVDPFEWGSNVEEIIVTMEEQATMEDLEQRGLAKGLAAVALTTLFLAGMVEVVRGASQGLPSGRGSRSSRGPADEGSAPANEPQRPAARDDTDDDRDPSGSGLVVHRRSGWRGERPKPEPGPPAPGDPCRDAGAGSSQGTPAKSDGSQLLSHDAMIQHLAARLSPYRGKNYYAALRVSEHSSADQIERSFRFLLRQLDEAEEDPSTRVIRDLLHEAHGVLSSAVEGPRYRDLAERAKLSSQAVSERQAFEAPPKIDRALRAMADGRTAEAAYLLDWSNALDPSRRDVKIYRGLVVYFRAPKNQRFSEASALRSALAAEVQRAPHDPRLKLCLALSLAECGDLSAARQIADSAPDPGHPLVRRLRELLASR